jgi:class 3 adenylate cyclase
VLFADLIDSTPLSASMDPEDWAEILHAYQRSCVATIESAGGVVAEVQGDGVVGYFGYHHASESDAERAIRAGLALCDTIPKGPTAHGAPLGVRVGIATGLVLADHASGATARGSPGAVGQTLNLAARLQGLAAANEVVIADATRRLAGGLFACEDRGQVTLKGFADVVQVWQVTGPTQLRSRIHAASGASPARMVGRQAELGAVLAAWRDVQAGQGRMVTIVGEAGLGKSRFVAEFRNRIAAQRHAWVEDGGSQFFSGTPFHPVSQMIRRILDPAGSGLPGRFHERLRRVLRRYDFDHASALSAFADMLDLPVEADRAQAMAPTAATRALLFAALLEWVRGAARSRPLVIVFEDTHWADASSLELVDYIAAAIAAMPVLLLTTSRQAPQPGQAAAGRILVPLRPLADAELRDMISAVPAAADALAPADLTRVIQRAGGVPLFGVELAHLVREQRTIGSGLARPEETEVPASLADLLMARLDQLGAAKGLAQLAAVIGTEVPRAVLMAVSGTPEGALRTNIAALRQHGILNERDRSRGVYAFRHAMLRDAAYASLPKTRRRDLHRAIALAIRDGAGGPAASKAEILAYHWSNAGEYGAAVAAWTEAGQYASDRRAFVEAESAFGAALAALRQQPDSVERDSQELRLLGLYANVLRITQGLSAPPTLEATRRARGLADARGDSEQQLLQAWGTWAAASSGGDFDTGLVLANEFELLAFANGLPRHLAAAHMMLMTSKFRVGDIGGAEEAFRRGSPYFDDAAFRAQPGWVAQTFGNAAMIAWTLGDDAAADRRIAAALFPGRGDDNPFDTVYGQTMHTAYLNLIGRYAEAARHASDSIALCEKYGIAQFAASTRVILGRARVGLGLVEEGVALMREGIAAMQAKRIRVAMTRYATWLAEGCLVVDDVANARIAADEALTVNPREFFYRPESMRVRGLIGQKAGHLGEADQDFSDAEQLARRMGATRLAERARESLHTLRRGIRLHPA